MSCEKGATDKMKNYIYIHYFILPHFTFTEDPFISYKYDLLDAKNTKNEGKFYRAYYQLDD